MKKKLLTILLSCALAFSATACGSSATADSAGEITEKETETKTPIEEAIESTKTIGEINREAAAAGEASELPEIAAEISEVPETSETTDAGEDYVANYIEGIVSGDTSSSSIDTSSVTAENTTTGESVTIMNDTSAEQDISSAFQGSMNEDLLSSLTGNMSSGSALTELPDNITFTLPEGFYEAEDGMYMNYDDSNPACIGCYVFSNAGLSTDTSLDADSAEIKSYFEALATEMETEFYNSYGVNINVSVLEGNVCQVNGNDAFSAALQCSAPDYDFTMLQFVGAVGTQDYTCIFYCMEALGTNYYDDFKTCFNSINIQ